MVANKQIKDMTPEELEEARRSLEQAGIERNKVTLAEFEKFRPLFERNPGHSQEQLQQLSQEFQQTFNMFVPIFIYSDHTEQAELVQTIPPLFQSPSTVNEVEDGEKTLTKLTKAMSREDNPVRADREIAASETANLFNNLGVEESEEEQKVWDDAVNTSENGNNIEEDIEFE